MKKIILFFICLSFSYYDCKKKENKEDPFKSNFTLNAAGERFDTPIAYVRKEGYDPKKQIYYLSLMFPTNGIYMDANTGSFTGYGEAVQFFIYGPSLNEIPVGKYAYNIPIDTSDFTLQIQTIYTYTNYYAFTFNANNKGTKHIKTKGCTLNISKSGEIYDIRYSAIMTTKDLNLNDIDSYYEGVYKGTIVFQK